jgi:signal transduction histidine kinase
MGMTSLVASERQRRRTGRASFLRRYVGHYERQCEEDAAERALRLSRDEAQLSAERARAAQATAEAATRAKAAFMATMSRELCGPLEAIIRLAQARRPEDAPAAACGDEIGDVAGQLRDIVGDVLELARIEAGESALVEEDLNLDSVIAASLEGIDARAQAKGVTVDFFPTATRIRGDGRRLRRIFDDVLTHALRSTPAGGGIAIELFEERAGGLMLSVIDGGAGMTPAEVDQALQPIGEPAADDRRADIRQLSLAVAKAFIELQGGQFFIETVPGSGTAACIYLPPRSVRRSA